MQILIVMDMQQALFTVPRYKKDVVVANIRSLITAQRKLGGMVLHVRHNGLAEDGMAPGMEGWEFLAEIDMQPDDPVIEKTTCDAFYGTDLERSLRETGAESIIITGCCTDFCVDTTVRAAVSRNFKVIVPADAHTTADRPHLESELVVAHHNWCWENLTTPATPVLVKTTGEVLETLVHP